MRTHYKFWPRRLPHAITPPATSLWENLAISARRYPEKAALVFFGRVFSYEDVLRKAERLAPQRVAVVAFSVSADTEMGDYDENPVILFRSGPLPPPFDEA